MRILLEAHHPAHIHFWKYPIRELQARGHEVRMIGRKRDVMERLIAAYSWIDAVIPDLPAGSNRFPLEGMLRRQWFVAKMIREFRPDVVASLMGSYTQSAKLLGVRNVVFTDSEFQHFNHRIAHPFADEIHTPECFYKELGVKQIRYPGIHEMAFLSSKVFESEGVDAYLERDSRKLGVIRLSAWNTLHDVGHIGIGDRLEELIVRFNSHFQFLIVAEEGMLPPRLAAYGSQIPPELFHSVLSEADFVLTEGASTASEAACLGTPTVYINSTEERGYLQWLEAQGRLYCYQSATEGLSKAMEVLDEVALSGAHNSHAPIKGFDLVRYVLDVLTDER